MWKSELSSDLMGLRSLFNPMRTSFIVPLQRNLQSLKFVFLHLKMKSAPERERDLSAI